MGTGWLALCAALCAAAGCGQERRASADAEISVEAQAQALTLFAERCARCHGPLGKGDGPEAAKLAVRPRNFADPTWQLAVPDVHLERVVVQGGAAVGKSDLMPAHPDLASRPELLRALRRHLRVLAASR